MDIKINDIKKRIQHKLSSLTPSQKIIADYILKNPQKFALCSVRELEKELNISKSTIVRFTQMLGYDGFYQLRSEFLKSMRNELDPIKKYSSFLTKFSDEQDFLQILSQETMHNIESTIRMLDKKQYMKVIKLLESADHVYTMGLGMSHFFSEIASYLFNRVSIKSDAIERTGTALVEKVVNISEKDLLFAFSFPKYSEETIMAAEYAYKRKIKVVSITDKATSDIVRFSTISLQVNVESVVFTNCMTSVLVLLYSIVSQLGLETKDKTLKTIKNLTYVREKYNK